jgi:hypothetical protein
LSTRAPIVSVASGSTAFGEWPEADATTGPAAQAPPKLANVAATARTAIVRRGNVELIKDLPRIDLINFTLHAICW